MEVDDVTQAVWLGGEKRPRVRGLRFPALPSGPLTAQLAGGVATLVGVYSQWGMGITLIVGGISAALLGALRESKKI